MEYISEYAWSGVLELYVLGALPFQERLKLENVASTCPLIKNELDEIECALEQYALKNAIEPSASLRQQILNNPNLV